MKIVKYALLFTAVVLLVLQPAAAACTVNSLTKFVPLGSQIVTDSAFKQELDNADLSTLKSSTVNFQGTQYNNREVVVFHNYTGGINGEVGPRLATSLTSIGGTEDDYKDGIYLETSKGAMGFFIVFDTPIDISKATKAEPLSLNILGKRIDITSVTGGKTFAARVWDNEDKLMNVGDSFIVNSKTVTLVDVSQNQNTATISVRDKKSNIKKTITGLDNINGLDVEIIESHYSAKNSEKWALIVAGTYSAKQYSDGDAFVVPCGQKYKRAECKKDNPDWVWDIDGLTTNAAGNTLTVGDNNARPSIGVINDYIVNDFSDNPITVGGVYDFPQAKNPLQVKFFNLPAANYATLDISFKPSEDFSAVFPQQNSEPAILLEASESDAIKVFDGRKYTKTNKIWLSYNDAQPSTSIDVLYLNPADNTVKLAQTIDQTKSNYNSEIGRVAYGASGSNKVAVMKLKGNPASADDLHLLFEVKGIGIASGSDDIDVWLGGDGEFTSIGAQNPSEVKPEIEMGLPKEVLKGETFDMQIIGSDNKLLDKVQIFKEGSLVATLSDNLGDYFTTKESFTENALGTYNYLVKGIDVDGNSASVNLTVSVVDQVQQTDNWQAVGYPYLNSAGPAGRSTGDEANELVYAPALTNAFLGTKDENHRTRYGTVLQIIFAQEVALKVGDSVTVEGKKVTLNDVKAPTISGDGETVNGLYIQVIDTHYSDNLNERSATLVIEGSEFSMNAGDTVTVSGKKVTLKNVGSATTNTPVIVDVDGVVETITSGSSVVPVVVSVDGTKVTIGTSSVVNGLVIINTQAKYSDKQSEKSATLIIKGASAQEHVKLKIPDHQIRAMISVSKKAC